MGPTVDLYAIPSFAKVRISCGRGDFSGLINFEHIRGIEFYVPQILVYNVLGGTERI